MKIVQPVEKKLDLKLYRRFAGRRTVKVHDACMLSSSSLCMDLQWSIYSSTLLKYTAKVHVQGIKTMGTKDFFAQF